MTLTAIYLPGLDGGPFSADKIGGHLSQVRIEVFSYPEGVSLGWEVLCRQVAERVRRSGDGLLIGESFGGAVAQEVALRHGQLLRSVFLLSTFSREAEAFAATLGRAAVRCLPLSLLKPVARGLADWKLAGTLKREDRRKFLDRFTSMDLRELGSRLSLLSEFDTRLRLASLSVPVEVAYGKLDPIAGAEDQLQSWEDLKDCRVHAIEGFGHLVSAEAAPAVARLIEDWALRHAGGK
jgi:pimeloyl-ACP methyl ester carboxylesterase